MLLSVEEVLRKYGVDRELLEEARPYLELIGLAWLIRLSKEAGIELRELIKSVKNIAEVEALTADSVLTLDEAIKIAETIKREGQKR